MRDEANALWARCRCKLPASYRVRVEVDEPHRMVVVATREYIRLPLGYEPITVEDVVLTIPDLGAVPYLAAPRQELYVQGPPTGDVWPLEIAARKLQRAVLRHRDTLPRDVEKIERWVAAGLC